MVKSELIHRREERGGEQNYLLTGNKEAKGLDFSPNKGPIYKQQFRNYNNFRIIKEINKRIYFQRQKLIDT